MSFELIGHNVVILANAFNPTIINQLWLVRHAILTEDDPIIGSAFTPVFANVKSRRFEMLFVSDRVQFTPNLDEHDRVGLARDVLRRLVRALPETPYTAIGINMTFAIKPLQGVSMERLSRSLFHRDSIPICRYFNAPDAKCGFYASQDFEGCRLRCEVKPVVFHGGDREHQLHCNYNFNRELVGQNAPDEIERVLELGQRASQISEEITGALDQWGVTHVDD